MTQTASFVGVLCVVAMSAPSISAGQEAIFADGLELGHTCRWDSAAPSIDCSFYEITALLPGDVTVTLVRIPAGTFFVGSPTDERGRLDDEDLHQVTLTQDYYIGKYEVTQAQWQAVMGTPMPTDCGSYGTGSDYPVYCLSWNDIAGPGGFIEKLNAYLSTSTFRLPTEAEWERAARAGNQDRFSHGDLLECDDDCGECTDHDRHMWWCGNSTGTSHPVGSKQANAYGLYDMHGSLWEWVQDWYTSNLGRSSLIDPEGPSTGFIRVHRGGYWNSCARGCRSASRTAYFPGIRYHWIGFRLAMTAP